MELSRRWEASDAIGMVPSCCPCWAIWSTNQKRCYRNLDVLVLHSLSVRSYFYILGDCQIQSQTIWIVTICRQGTASSDDLRSFLQSTKRRQKRWLVTYSNIGLSFSHEACRPRWIPHIEGFARHEVMIQWIHHPVNGKLATNLHLARRWSVCLSKF